MSIAISCGNCGKKYKIGDDKAGKKFRCKECSEPIRVPVAENEFGDSWDELCEDYGAPSAALPPVSGSAASQGRSSSSRGKKRPARKSKSGPNVGVIAIIAASVLLLVGASVGVWSLAGGFGGEPTVFDFITQEDEAAIVIHPKRLLDAPLLAALPMDDSIDKFIEETGIDPRGIKQVTVLMQSSNLQTAVSAGPRALDLSRMQDAYSVVVEFSQPFDIQTLIDKSVDELQFETATHDGNAYHRITPSAKNASRSDADLVIGAHAASETLLVVAAESRLQKMLSTGGASTKLTSMLKDADLDNDIVMVALNDPDASANQQTAQNVPAPLAPYAKIPQLMTATTVIINLSGETILAVSLEGKDSAATQELNELVTKGLEQAKALATIAGMGSAPGSSSGNGPNPMATLTDFVNKIQIDTTGNNVAVTFPRPEGLDELIASTMVPAVAQARTAATQTAGRNNLKQIGIAWHNFHDTFKSLPPGSKKTIDKNHLDANGRPFLSWRVHILPFLGQQALYDNFHLDEPWDSAHNRPLLAEMPDVYKSLGSDTGTTTRYLSFDGNGAILEDGLGVHFRNVKDGTSNTLAVVEVGSDRAVPWTKPEDVEFSPTAPVLSLLGAIGADGFSVLLCDGSTRTISPTTKDQTLKALITKAGSEVVGDF